MIILKILGAIDLLSAFTFLLLVFGISPPLHLTMFCFGLLFAKGLFILTGDIFSIQDLIFSILLFLSIFFTLPAFLLWIAALLLLAKAMASFL